MASRQGLCASPAAGGLMEHPGFFERAGPFSLRTVAEATGAEMAEGVDPDIELEDVRPLDSATKGDLCFLDNPRYMPLLADTGASACLVAPRIRDKVPAGTVPVSYTHLTLPTKRIV